MLCDRCTSVIFDFGPIAGPRKDSALYILHKDHDSFLRSISLGCHLCTLIKGQLNSNHDLWDKDDPIIRKYLSDASIVLPDICDKLDGYIIVTAKLRENGTLSGWDIISRAGQASLNTIDPLPGLNLLSCTRQNLRLTRFSQRLIYKSANLTMASQAQVLKENRKSRRSAPLFRIHR